MYETGVYIQIVLGPSEDQTKRTFQIIGLAASLVSISKGTAEWWVRSRSEKYPEPTFWESAKASLFFMPHIVFRTISMTMCGALLGYYILVPAFIIVIIVFFNFFFLARNKDKEFSPSLPLTFAFTLFSPMTMLSYSQADRTLMKRTITITTSVLLATLTLVRILPLLVAPDKLVATYGLRHLNFLSPTAGVFKLLTITNKCNFSLADSNNPWPVGYLKSGILC